jgi:signal peptidase I
MLITALVCLIFGGLSLILLLVSAGFLRIGARMVGAPSLGFMRAVLAVLLLDVTGMVVRVFVLHGAGIAFRDHLESYSLLAPIAAGDLSLLAMCGVAQWYLRTTLGKAILALIPMLLVAWAISWAMVMAVVRPFLFEAYSQPTNGMAPTILGRHLVGTCPSCGGTAYISAASLADLSPRTDLGICGRCLRASTVAAIGHTVSSGDFLIAAKFLRPRRWDLVVFRYPEDPSINYVMRVVGLPGEQVELKDGDVWIDGARASKPAEIAGLVYLAHPIDEERATWGPGQLGRGEYFVLGDFSRRAKDSRVWETGAPGHPSYAVPESYVVGVVTHIYWPFRRWRSFR